VNHPEWMQGNKNHKPCDQGISGGKTTGSDIQAHNHTQPDQQNASNKSYLKEVVHSLALLKAVRITLQAKNTNLYQLIQKIKHTRTLIQPRYPTPS